MEASTNIFKGGLQRDVSEPFIPADSYYDALNAVLENEYGHLTSLSNELGNLECLSLPASHRYVGSILTNTDDIVIFSTNDTVSAIGIFNPNSCKYTSVMENECLGFTTKTFVKGIFRLRKGCERIIYFTDTVNSYKIINLDDLDQYKDEDGEWDCSRMSQTREVMFPKYSNVTVLESGGQLEVGAYQLSLRYLDDDLNPTNWTFPSQSIYVHQGSYSDWSSITGQKNIKYKNDIEGGVPTTSKLINVELERVDTRYTYLEVAVLKNVESLGTTTSVYAIHKIPILNQTTLNFNVTGAASEFAYNLNLSEIQIDFELIDVVNSVQQLDNTCFLGGVKTKTYDWSAYQRAANNIRVKWTTDKVRLYDATQKGNSKNWLTGSFQSEEIECLGVVYVHRNGLYSPVMHIPGREAVASDRIKINSWNPDIDHIVSSTNFTPNTIEDWQWKDTASADGTLGFYEVSSSYPTTLDCNGEPVFGDLAGEKIRHHKLPSRTLAPLTEEVNGELVSNNLALEFENITYPNPDIVGHFFVRGARVDGNKTVLDNAVMFLLKPDLGTVGNNTITSRYETDFNMSSYRNLFFGNNRRSRFHFYSPKQLFKNELTDFNFIKLNGAYPLASSGSFDRDYPTTGFLTGAATVRAEFTSSRDFEILYPTAANAFCQRKIDTKLILQPNAQQDASTNFPFRLWNTSLSYSTGVFQTENDVSTNELNWELSGIQQSNFRWRGFNVLLKSYKEVFTDIFNINYIPINTHILELSDPQVSHFSDIFIGELNMMHIHDTRSSEFAQNGDAKVRFMLGHWLESNVNVSLRAESSQACETHMSNFVVDQFRAPYSFPNNNFICNYVMTKVADQDADNGRWRFKENGVVCKEGVMYNLDYSKTADQKPYFTLISNYDYCTTCQNSYPHRIHWSLTDNLETDRDNYRVFLANNYRNLDGLGDDIEELIVHGDDLFVATANFIYSVPVRPSEIKVQNSIAYLGTGEKLSGPIKKLASPAYAYGGTDQRVAILSTEFGIFYPDRKTKKVYSISGKGIEELSSKSMSTFFENNLELKLESAFLRDTMEAYPLVNAPYHVAGIGFQSAYDPRFKRLILSKKDYSPLLSIRLIDSTDYEINSLTSSVIYFDKTLYKFFVGTGFGLFEIFLDNTAYFKDMSWTVSYNFKLQAWASFHSYRPDGLFNNHNGLFSVKNSKIWTHNMGNYSTYYGIKYPHYVEFVLNHNPNMYKMLESLVLDHKVLNNQTFENKTFDKLNIYNKEHNTGTLNIQRFTDFIRPAANECVARHVGDKYNINLFRNYTTSIPTYRLENTSNIINTVDFNKSQFLLDRPTGQWLFVRLTLDNNNNYLSILDGVNNIHYNTAR